MLKASHETYFLGVNSNKGNATLFDGKQTIFNIVQQGSQMSASISVLHLFGRSFRAAPRNLEL